METQASVKTKCDGCGATLSTNSAYADKRGSMSLTLKDGQDEQGYDKNSRYDYCGEACMLAHLTSRAKASKNQAKGNLPVNFTKGTVELDITSDARYISTKDRNKMGDSDFIDPERRSFPIKTCEDVKAAVHAWGRYTGSMSFAEFKSKLTSKAKALGCTLPASWEDSKK